MVTGDVIPDSVSTGDPTQTSLTSIQTHFSPKLSVYKGNCKDPEILIIGDSIIRSVSLPGAFTYCLSGGRVADMIELASALFDLLPSAHTAIFHVCTNDILDRKSIILHDLLESLAVTVQSLGKICVFSGPIPAPSKS